MAQNPFVPTGALLSEVSYNEGNSVRRHSTCRHINKLLTHPSTLITQILSPKRHQNVMLFFAILFFVSFEALLRLLRISKIFAFCSYYGRSHLIGAKAWLMYIAVWESQSPSPLALQKTSLLFEVLCALRGFAKRNVSQTTMLLRLSRPYSYDPRPISKKAKKSDILTKRCVISKGNKK